MLVGASGRRTTMMTKPLDRAKLAKLCEMLASSHDGEVLAAARKASKRLRAAKTTWTEAINPSSQLSPMFKPAAEQPHPWGDPAMAYRRSDLASCKRALSNHPPHSLISSPRTS